MVKLTSLFFNRYLNHTFVNWIFTILLWIFAPFDFNFAFYFLFLVGPYLWRYHLCLAEVWADICCLVLSCYMFVYVHVSNTFHFIMVCPCNFYFQEYKKIKKKKKNCHWLPHLNLSLCVLCVRKTVSFCFVTSPIFQPVIIRFNNTFIFNPCFIINTLPLEFIIASWCFSVLNKLSWYYTILARLSAYTLCSSFLMTSRILGSRFAVNYMRSRNKFHSFIFGFAKVSGLFWSFILYIIFQLRSRPTIFKIIKGSKQNVLW